MFTKMALQDPEVPSESEKRDKISPLSFVSNPSVRYCILIPWKILIHVEYMWSV